GVLHLVVPEETSTKCHTTPGVPALTRKELSSGDRHDVDDLGQRSLLPQLLPKETRDPWRISALSEQLEQECDSVVQQRHSAEEFSKRSSRG
ncbi:hypothetical protein Tco_0376320, partial [Tanacetum coccineum]